jgi:hypothetical protein
LALLWAIKSVEATSIAFPVMVGAQRKRALIPRMQLVVMVGVRKLLDGLFTQKELSYLDDIMPPIQCLRRHSGAGAHVDNVENGNVTNASVSTKNIEERQALTSS